jgi:HSP20 family protein
MARQRDLLVNFQRMRREMDELFGDVWGEGWWPGRPQSQGFSPHVDIYYCDADPPLAVVRAELAGVNLQTVDLEVAGRDLVISGERPVREPGGRLYQQVEIEAGPFRRVVELNADVVSEEARATYEDGILRIELPLRRGGQVSRRVPIEPRE